MDYLIIKDNTIIQICSSDRELLEYLDVNITNDGIIEVTKDGRQLPTSFDMKQYTKEEVIKYLIVYQLNKIAGMLQIGIYKIERI